MIASARRNASSRPATASSRNWISARMRSRIFIAPSVSGGSAAAIARSMVSIQAPIIPIAPSPKASRATSASAPTASAAVTSAASLHPSKIAASAMCGARCSRSSSSVISPDDGAGASLPAIRRPDHNCRRPSPCALRASDRFRAASRSEAPSARHSRARCGPNCRCARDWHRP